MNRCLLLVASCLIITSHAIAQQAKTSAEARPNIVLILADDLGIGDLHCYGRKDHKTPNLDRLAKSGTQFNCAYCALPICSASRAGLLTGHNPARLHLTTYLPGRPDAPSQKLLQPRIEPALIPSEQTIAEVLKREGYDTAIFGKWHLGGGDSEPTKQGFDVAFEPPGNGDPATTGGKNERLITEKAIEFIQAPRDKPYFCYVPHHSPHIMLKETEEKVKSNATAWNPLYAATIESLDEAIGDLLKAIEATPSGENTIVIFTSDNGGLHVPEGHEEPVTHNGRFRAGKGYLYEGGLRVPLIVHWPKRFDIDQKVDAPVSLLDILPTLLSATGVSPAKSVGPLDGKSFASILSNESIKIGLAERDFYWHIPHYTNQGSRPAGAIRRGNWKLVEDYESGALELYDLATDIGEQHNLASEKAELAEDLRSALDAWRTSFAAQMPSPNADFDAAAHAMLYVDRDSSRLIGAHATSKQVAADWKSWRTAMNKAIAGQKTVLNNSIGAIRLSSSKAKAHGAKIRYEPETNKNVVGYWTEEKDWVEWQFDSTIEGPVEIQIHCGCNGGGSQVAVILETSGEPDQRLEWTVRNTGHFQNMVIESIGIATLRKGACRLAVKPTKKVGAAIADIRQILLVPPPK